jgi:hypothetical protein
MPVRSQIENAFKYNIFLPTAIKHNFREITQAELDHGVRRPFKEREPVIPDFDWRYKTNLLDDASFRELIVRLNQQVKMPMKVVSEVLGMDYDYIKTWIKKEEGTVFDGSYQEWRKGNIIKPKGAGFKDLEFQERMKKGDFISQTEIEKDWEIAGMEDAWEAEKAKGSLAWLEKKGMLPQAKIAEMKEKIDKDLWLKSQKSAMLDKPKKPTKDKAMVSIPEFKGLKPDQKAEGREFDFASRGGFHRKTQILEALFSAAKSKGKKSEVINVN